MPSGCRGVICRYSVSSGYSEAASRFSEIKALRVLKNKSCLECDDCKTTWDAVASLLLMPKGMQTGALYRAVLCNKNGLTFKEFE